MERSRFGMARLLPALLVAGAVGAAWGVAGAQEEAAEEGGIQVGTYEPQDAFMAYHRTDEFQREMQDMQAQIAEDPQRAAEMQQVVQQRHEELIRQFEEDVQEAVEEIAQEQQVDLIAIGVVYSGPQVRVSDVTEAVVEKINEGVEAPEQELPDFLQQ